MINYYCINRLHFGAILHRWSSIHFRHQFIAINNTTHSIRFYASNIRQQQTIVNRSLKKPSPNSRRTTADNSALLLGSMCGFPGILYGWYANKDRSFNIEVRERIHEIANYHVGMVAIASISGIVLRLPFIWLSTMNYIFKSKYISLIGYPLLISLGIYSSQIDTGTDRKHAIWIACGILFGALKVQRAVSTGAALYYFIDDIIKALGIAAVMTLAPYNNMRSLLAWCYTSSIFSMSICSHVLYVILRKPMHNADAVNNAVSTIGLPILYLITLLAIVFELYMIYRSVKLTEPHRDLMIDDDELYESSTNIDRYRSITVKQFDPINCQTYIWLASAIVDYLSIIVNMII